MLPILSSKSLYEFAYRNRDKIEGFKITKVEKTGFNDMEGWQYYINVKFFTKKGYKNKILTLHTNSTYVEDYEGYNDLKELFTDMVSDLMPLLGEVEK